MMRIDEAEGDASNPKKGDEQPSVLLLLRVAAIRFGIIHAVTAAWMGFCVTALVGALARAFAAAARRSGVVSARSSLRQPLDPHRVDTDRDAELGRVLLLPVAELPRARLVRLLASARAQGLLPRVMPRRPRAGAATARAASSRRASEIHGEERAPIRTAKEDIRRYLEYLRHQRMNYVTTKANNRGCSTVLCPPSHVPFMVFAAMAVLCGHTAAQHGRQGGIISRDATFGARHGRLEAEPASGGNGCVLSWMRRSPLQSASASLPMNAPGDACRVSEGSIFIVVGAQVDHQATPPTSAGVVAIVQLDDVATSMTVLATNSYADCDFIDVTYNESESLCYVINRTGADLRVAPWSLGGPLPPAFAPIASSVDAPFLAGQWIPSLKSNPLGSGVRVVARSSEAHDHYPTILGYDVRYIAPNWVTTIADSSSAPILGWNFGSYRQNARGPQLSVAGVTGAFAIALAGGSDIISGVTTSQEVTAVAIGPGAVQPGAVYYVRSLAAGVKPSPFLPINSMWGQQCAGTAVNVTRSLLSDCHVGNGAFRAQAQMEWLTASEAVGTKQIFLALGFFIPGTEDVTVHSNGCATMGSIGAIIGPVDVQIRGMANGQVGIPLPVPNDSGLAGIHVVMQWVAIDGAGLALSEVFGTMIFPAPTAFASGSGTGGPLVPGSAAAQQALHRAGAWCDSRPEMAWNSEKREVRKKLKRL
jgi:hypothetical protein